MHTSEACPRDRADGVESPGQQAVSAASAAAATGKIAVITGRC